MYTQQLYIYLCEQCDYEANVVKTLIYVCEQCEYEANVVKTLRVNSESRHEGIKYPCDQCKHVALSKRSHKFHKECWLQESPP